MTVVPVLNGGAPASQEARPWVRETGIHDAV
jgi:hypothetical protein